MARASWMRAASVMAAMFLVAAPARAQATTGEIRSSAQIVAGVSIQGPAPHVGVALSAGAFLLTERLAGVAEVSLDQHRWAALAGPQVGTLLIRKRSTQVRLFAQSLWGLQWNNVGPRQGVFQPGLGLDDYLFDRVIVRVAYDYRFAPNGARNLSTGRFVFGIGLPLAKAVPGDDLSRVR